MPAQIFVFFPDEVKVGVKTIKVFAERMRNESVQRAIMVVIGSLTPFSRQCLAEMQPTYYIEMVRAHRRLRSSAACSAAMKMGG